MSQFEGKVIVCDRCGNYICLRKTGTNKLDGGYTEIPVYDKKPAGWEKSATSPCCDLCPECNAVWKDVLHRFMNPPNLDAVDCTLCQGQFDY